MSMEICWVSTPVDPWDQKRFENEPGWLEAMRGTAVRALADLILRDGKALYRRIEPDKNTPDARIKHQWTVALESDLGEIAAREKQVEEARRQGRSEAAALCIEAATRYRNQASDGMCKWVIASALEDAAKAISSSA